MTPEDRFSALAAVDAAALEALADEVLGHGPDVSVVTGPESVSAPVRIGVPGSGHTTVVLGHIALTRCTVLLDGTRGDGLRIGYDPPGAVAAAVCDAECERAGRMSTQVIELCRTAQRAESKRRGQRADLVATTTLEAP